MTSTETVAHTYAGPGVSFAELHRQAVNAVTWRGGTIHVHDHGHGRPCAGACVRVVRDAR